MTLSAEETDLEELYASGIERDEVSIANLAGGCRRRAAIQMVRRPLNALQHCEGAYRPRSVLVVAE